METEIHQYETPHSVEYHFYLFFPSIMAEVRSEVVQGFDSEGNYHDVIYDDLLKNNPPEGIEIHPLCRRLIDTPEFQRLKDIKQLDQLDLMFDNATHTR